MLASEEKKIEKTLMTTNKIRRSENLFPFNNLYFENINKIAEEKRTIKLMDPTKGIGAK